MKTAVFSDVNVVVMVDGFDFDGEKGLIFDVLGERVGEREVVSEAVAVEVRRRRVSRLASESVRRRCAAALSGVNDRERNRVRLSLSCLEDPIM